MNESFIDGDLLEDAVKNAVSPFMRYGSREEDAALLPEVQTDDLTWRPPTFAPSQRVGQDRKHDEAMMMIDDRELNDKDVIPVKEPADPPLIRRALRAKLWAINDDDTVEKNVAADLAAAFRHDNDDTDNDGEDEARRRSRFQRSARAQNGSSSSSSSSSVVLPNILLGNDNDDDAEEARASNRSAAAAAAVATAAALVVRLPVFLKFHKVGGTTIASCLRKREVKDGFGVLPIGTNNYWCCDGLIQEEEEQEQGQQQQQQRRRRRGHAKKQHQRQQETGCHGGGTAYDHNTLSVYQEHGLRGFRVCTSFRSAFRPNVVAFVLLRDPLQRWLSGLYYWGEVYTNPTKRLCLARQLYAPLKHEIRAAYNRLVEAPQSVTPRDVDLMSMCIYGDRFSGQYYDRPASSSSSSSLSPSLPSSDQQKGEGGHDDHHSALSKKGGGSAASPSRLLHGTWNERPIPGPPAGTPALEYAFWLSSPRNTTAPTEDEVATATSRLSRDFTVGLTNDMPSFFALVAMKLHWPLHFFCCIARNVNAKTGNQKLWLPPSVLAHGRAKLRADFEIYAFAELLHARQVQQADEAAAEGLWAKEHGGYSSGSGSGSRHDGGSGGGGGGEHARLVRRFRSEAFARDECRHDIEK